MINSRQPSKNDIKIALAQSGYLIEQSIAQILEEDGFIVDTNYHYQDPEDNVSREMDIRAYSLKKISRRWLSHHLSITLIISCKANSNPIIFFQRKTNLPPEYISGDFLTISNPEKIPGLQGEPIDIQDFINLRKFHHYYKSPNISTQFCSIIHNEKNKSFETRHEEYKSEILPLVKALDFEIKKIKKDPVDEKIIYVNTFYPIIVLGGDMYECRVTKDRHAYVKKTQHVDYLQTYNSGTLQGEFRIDIVTQAYLKKLLEQINKETDEIVRRVNGKKQRMLEVIKNNSKNVDKIGSNVAH
jgi:hypothetical protein